MVVTAATPTRHSVTAVELDVIARTHRRPTLATPTRKIRPRTRPPRHSVRPSVQLATSPRRSFPLPRRQASTVHPILALAIPIGTRTEVAIPGTITQSARLMVVTAVTPTHHSVTAVVHSVHAWIPLRLTTTRTNILRIRRLPIGTTRPRHLPTTTTRTRRHPTTRTRATPLPCRQVSTVLPTTLVLPIGTRTEVVIQSTTTQSARSMVVTAVTPTRHSVMEVGLSAHAWIPRRPTTTRTTILRPHRLPIGTGTRRTRRQPTTPTRSRRQPPIAARMARSALSVGSVTEVVTLSTTTNGKN
jgi:hypothetical protein